MLIELYIKNVSEKTLLISINSNTILLELLDLKIAKYIFIEVGFDPDLIKLNTTISD